ncbi:DUF2637 domain-containing protein, partial [Streptomyces sp. NPDC055796]
EALMPLRLARIGVPLAQTAPEGLAAAGIDPLLLPPAAAAIASGAAPAPASPAQAAQAAQLQAAAPALETAAAQQGPDPRSAPAPVAAPPVTHAPPPFAVEPTAMPAAHDSAWFAAPLAPQAAYEGGYNPQYVEGLEPTPVMPPAGPDQEQEQDLGQVREQQPVQEQLPAPRREARPEAAGAVSDIDEAKFAEAAYEVFRTYIEENGKVPSPEQVDIYLSDRHGINHPLAFRTISRLMPELKQRYQRDLENEHIP